MVKRLNRVNDPASNAPRESQRQKGEIPNRISDPYSLGWERRTSCTLPHSVGHIALQRACCKDL
ncbi:hypothetical protein PS914_05986 [Pseudomonas fluorescens]|nr:hypothetical protein PS914_05986 [Pseudomonas fluorescens]